MSGLLLMEGEDLLAILIEKMEVVVLLLESPGGHEGLNDFLFRRVVGSGVLQVSGDVAAPFELAVVDLEVEDVAVTVRERHGLLVEGELEGLLQDGVVDLDQVPQANNVQVIFVHLYLKLIFKVVNRPAYLYQHNAPS